ncbi:TPA: ATP-dependent DNA helicase RecG [Neisseria meningitidis]|uniref:ATP-dependent DNA helicase RecG n=1 Tax=Neisseria meningitidis TaxID=487 RepID=UPI00027C8470|nr:ATP-dependent DNA helicase RecG [Neisseria meningitidis]EJU68966.1 ATP-dependent DNA helicase RecG [Neisseria meningitidis 80179]MBH2267232.1 ATP-dependent DNA helicase RecG [Neisseria meningitidis]MBH2282915.1 ATP-dependent DNA helicase RecG [Neisseria meningitidis]MBH2355413.1 ATP-dependent DNA helicase RecG [Neisseria meningitidis]MBH2410809.1 ATP-dependent DNA helicase RecG [Neisseria meningitidis]
MMSPETQKQLKITDVSVKKLDKLNLHTAWDLVLHLPLRYEDETHIMPIKDAPIGVPCQVEGEVIHQEVTFKPRKQLIVQIADDSGSVLFLRFIHFYASHQKQTAVGKRIRAVGEIKHGFYGDEMIHPKIRDAEGGGLAESLTPVYPTVNGLNQPTLRRIIQTALDVTPLHDTLPDALLCRLKLPHLAESLRLLHSPPPSFTIHQLSDGTLPAWQRLKFDELLAQQLSMRLARQKRIGGTAAALGGDGTLTQALRQALPFALTDAQEKVVSEICRDMAQTYPMHRLLQGDVGSGKTIVAALSALTAIESGAQVAVMAPTEILAEQHFIKFKQWLEPLGIEVVRLFGSLRKKAKDEAKAKLADGSVKIAVGTHALFSDGVAFHNLGLTIVDEQHRFGVAQRLALKNKGREVHQLMMSATPIPRTLAMSFFADLDVSVIDELPPGRTPIKTRLVNNVRRAEVEGFVLGTCRKGRQAYWVCPLIEESETLQLQTAAETLARLQTALPELNIGLVHGRMKAAEKAEVMARFSSGGLNVLVATTVIEVGVDVPNAALMVIEHAERMGLAQLHQLRGRVGRGAAESVCVLLFAEPLGELAKARLKVIYEHTDGFEIARQDLNIRGPGEFLGARQSGVPMLRFAKLEEDLHLLEQARETAPMLIEQNPEIVEAHLARWLSGREGYLGV